MRELKQRPHTCTILAHVHYTSARALIKITMKYSAWKTVVFHSWPSLSRAKRQGRISTEHCLIVILSSYSSVIREYWPLAGWAGKQWFNARRILSFFNFDCQIILFTLLCCGILSLVSPRSFVECLIYLATISGRNHFTSTLESSREKSNSLH